MKSNFIISAYRDIWLEDAKRLFVIEPYVHHVLEKSGELNKFDEVCVASPIRVGRENIQRDCDFVSKKFHQYSDILCDRRTGLGHLKTGGYSE